jgi:DNA-binding GntR family transcriptional regulator
VRAIDEDYVRDHYELRRAVLGVLLPRVVRFISNADLEALAALEAAFEAAVASGALMPILEADRQFHAAVYGLARHPEALEVMHRTWLLIDALRLRFGCGEGRLAGVVAMHHALLVALARRDAEAATRLFQETNDSGLADLLIRMQGKVVAAARPLPPRGRGF